MINVSICTMSIAYCDTCLFTFFVLSSLQWCNRARFGWISLEFRGQIPNSIESYRAFFSDFCNFFFFYCFVFFFVPFFFLCWLPFSSIFLHFIPSPPLPLQFSFFMFSHFYLAAFFTRFYSQCISLENKCGNVALFQRSSGNSTRKRFSVKQHRFVSLFSFCFFFFVFLLCQTGKHWND